MSECTCHKNYTLDTLIPKVGVITDIRQETPDVKTFRVEAPEGGKLFEHMPGQCAMVCVPGVSEGMFSITSSPTVKDYQEFSIKKCGSLTDHLHSLQVGDEIAVRGPYGNHFPVEDKLKGKNLLFMSFIVLAYVFGILNKLFVSVDAAVYFYILNEAMVLADYILYFVNRHSEIQNGICKNYYNVYR